MTHITISGTSIKELKTITNKFLLLDSDMNVIRLPVKTKRFTLIRSPHVTNKSREQFEIHTYKWILQSNLPMKLIERFIEYRNLHNAYPGISINCSKLNKMSHQNKVNIL